MFNMILKLGLKLLSPAAFVLCILFTAACQYPVDPNGHALNGTEIPDRREITWDYVVQSAGHGFEGTLQLTKEYGRNNLTPAFDAGRGPSDWLYPSLLQDSLCMYKITRNDTYLKYARLAADSLEGHMLNDRGIIRMYSYRKGPSDTQPTDLNYYLLPAIAELSIYDPSYIPLARKVAYGIVRYGLSDRDIPYGAVYPNGAVAKTITGLPSNGGMKGTVALTVKGLLRTYQATGETIFLNRSRSILVSLWNNKRTKYNLIPTTFDSVSLRTTNSETQLYATGELLMAYVYYYYITQDPLIKEIIADYSSAVYDRYWSETSDGHGFFVYKLNVNKGRPFNPLLETNWHKLDMSLIYAGDITGRNYTQRVFQDMDTFWLGRGLAYRNHLFRHGTKTDGSPADNAQSLIYAGLRTAVYAMQRMQNQGAFNPSDQVWNEKVWNHIDALRSYHRHKYGYHTDIDIETLQPDAGYSGLSVISACDEFSSLATLLFQTTPEVKMAWVVFPKGNFSLEPFSIAYANDVAFMNDVFMDYSEREIAFRRIMSEGNGKIYCSQNLSLVLCDGKEYGDWHGNVINISNGSHEYNLVFSKSEIFTAPFNLS